MTSFKLVETKTESKSANLVSVLGNPFVCTMSDHRSTKAEFNERCKEAVALLIGGVPSRAVSKLLADKFQISSRQARTYAAEAKKLIEVTYTADQIDRKAVESSYKVDYFLTHAAQYIDDKITLNRMLRHEFNYSEADASVLIDEFERTKGPLGRLAAEKYQELKNYAYNLLSRKLNNKEWPKVGIFTCTDCDNKAQHYHHPNYAYPTWVEPVCAKCHVRIHAILYQRCLK